jgi:hypothetical protein
MNIFLWVLQILLALHTITGAFWKFSNSEQTVPSLAVMPHGVWLGLAVIELFCAVGFLLPAWKKRFAKWVPIAAAVIAAEMLLFFAIHLYSGSTVYSELVYWLVVAAICGFVGYARRKK